MRASDMPTEGGRAWQYSYDSGFPEVGRLGSEAFVAGLGANALDPTVFPSVMQMENEVVGMVGSLLGAGERTAGTFTSGGTESIFLAVKAARERLGRQDATILAPITAHAAFHKAAHYLGLEVVATEVDPRTLRADPQSIAAAIDERTALVVASAYGFAHGVLDPVEEIAAIAAANGAPCHVDACMGGLVLPFLREAGEPVPAFDLGVPGVTSLSADIHKFGYAPKGASVVLFADPDLRRLSYYSCARWTGYTLINATVQSSRSGGPLAAAWAVMQHLGREGYVKIAERVVAATRHVRSAVAEMDGVGIAGDPDANALAIAGEEGVDIFVVADELRERGWYLTPQLSCGPSPRSLSLVVDGGSLDGVEGFVAALAESVRAARAAGPILLDSAVVEEVRNLDPGSLDTAGFAALLERTGVGIEGGFAAVNNLLDAAPPAVREALLTGFLGTLFPPPGQGAGDRA